MAEDLGVEDQQQREVGGVEPGQGEPEGEQADQVDQGQRGPVLAGPEPLGRQVPDDDQRGQAGDRPAVAGGAGVEQDQRRGQGEQGVEGGVPDPGVLVPGVDRGAPALAALAVQPALLSSLLRDDGTRGRGRWGAPVGGSAGQPFG
jgi:hypothetical protein